MHGGCETSEIVRKAHIANPQNSRKDIVIRHIVNRLIKRVLVDHLNYTLINC